MMKKPSFSRSYTARTALQKFASNYNIKLTMRKTCPSRVQSDPAKPAAINTFKPQVVHCSAPNDKKNKLSQINLNLNDLDDEMLAAPFKKFKDLPVSNSISRNDSKKSDNLSKSNSFQAFNKTMPMLKNMPSISGLFANDKSTAQKQLSGIFERKDEAINSSEKKTPFSYNLVDKQSELDDAGYKMLMTKMPSFRNSNSNNWVWH